MNKFSSLSTSVLLALLTSSFSAAAYADGDTSLSRLSQRSSNDSAERQVMFRPTSYKRPEEAPLPEDGQTLLSAESSNSSENQLNTAQESSALTLLAVHDDLNAEMPIVSINSNSPLFTAQDTQNNLRSFHHAHSPDNAALSLAMEQSATADDHAVSSSSAHGRNSARSVIAASVEDSKGSKGVSLLERAAQSSVSASAQYLAEEEEEQISSPSDASDPSATMQNEDASLDSSAFVQSLSSQSADVGQSPIAMTRTQHSLQLSLGSSSGTALNSGEPTVMEVAFEHPSELRESFIVAGSTSVLSYSNEQSSFAISFKLRALDPLELHHLNFQQFKDRLTARFSDKGKMLYGEYRLLHAYANAKEALEAKALVELDPAQIQEQNLVLLPFSSDESYMDLSLRAFLKKGQDGILPDMQNFFYERNILNRGYLATLSCEFRGSQSQASIIRHQFETFSPLCERILNSYRFAFLAPKNTN